MTPTPARPVIASAHALSRWDERFAGHDLAAALARSVPVTAAKLIAWRQALGVPKCLCGILGARYRHDPATGALFVLDADTGRLITAYPLRRVDKKKRPRAARGDE